MKDIAIPEVVLIGGIAYDIELVNKTIKVLGEECYGCIDYNHTKILIGGPKICSDERRRHTLWHEFIHGVVQSRGIELPPEDLEAIVDQLAQGIHALFVDNCWKEFEQE